MKNEVELDTWYYQPSCVKMQSGPIPECWSGFAECAPGANIP